MKSLSQHINEELNEAKISFKREGRDKTYTNKFNITFVHDKGNTLSIGDNDTGDSASIYDIDEKTAIQLISGDINDLSSIAVIADYFEDEGFDVDLFID